MKPGSFLALTALTVIVLIAAVLGVVQQRSLTTIASDRDRAFEDLVANVNNVAEFAITSNEATFKLVRTGESWGLQDRANYRIHYDKVKKAIVGLAELKLLEAKTSDPARYARLQLEEPDKKGAESESVRFEIKDAKGSVLAAGLIGKQNPNLFGEGGGGTYLRRGKDAESWLAEGEVALGKTRNDWLVRDIVNIEAEDIAKAVIRQPGGVEIVVKQDKKGGEKFVLEGVPAGRKLKDSKEAKNLAGGLWRLTFEDVKPAKEIKFAATFNTAEYETFDGLKVRVEMTMVKDIVWGRFSASADSATGDKADAVKKKAEEINSRTTGWIYELSAGEGEKLTTKIEDILEKPPKKS